MRFSTLAQWLAWQETLHPSEIDLGLDRVAEVLQRLQLDHPDFTVITVAGTNGKGSSVAMLESILRAAGYRVGSYTSPHLLRYNERIRIDGAEVSDEALCKSFERIDQARGTGSQEVSLTYFEFGTLAAIDLLQHSGVEIAVLEVGLGGRLDAVNVLDADVALITAIDVDHDAWLGSDRETIAREKAGILRAGRPAVCSDPRPPSALVDYAHELGAPLQFSHTQIGTSSEQEWEWLRPDSTSLSLPRPALPGDFQLHNAAGVLATLACLAERFPVDAEAMAEGLRRVTLAGRFQVVPGTPQRILDVAHNPQSAQVLADNLRSRPCAGETRLVFAMLADKDIDAVVHSLRPQVNHWYLAELDVPRAASLAQLQAAVGEEASAYDSVAAAYATALADSAPQDRVVVAGSFYTVAAALAQPV